MTDYANMTDRELDALVAERVMGWTHIGTDDGRGIPPAARARESLPHYSTDANAALEALAKVYGHYLCIDREIGEEWECTIGSWDRDAIVVKKASPARAICEAILQATEPE